MIYYIIKYQDIIDVLGVLPYIMDAIIWTSYPYRLHVLSINMLLRCALNVCR
jgi:hypothetical protein